MLLIDFVYQTAVEGLIMDCRTSAHFQLVFEPQEGICCVTCADPQEDIVLHACEDPQQDYLSTPGQFFWCHESIM